MTDFSLLELPALSLAAALLILFAAGTTKGIVGIGLPIIAVPLLSKVVPLPTAVALMTIPLGITNLIQAYGTERVAIVLRRLLPIVLGTAFGIGVGVHLLTGLSPTVLKPLVGAVLIGVATLMLVSPKLACPPNWEMALSPIVGFAGGILGGLAGQPGPLVFIYLLSLGITGDRFVQYSSTFIFTASLMLTVALGRAGALGWSGAVISAAATIPILLGMWAGGRLRGGISAGLFRKAVLGIVILAGADLLGPGVISLFNPQIAPPAIAADDQR
jgi:uncharacterized protein